MTAPRLTLRIDLAGGAALGHGKVELLEAIARSGSISGAARELAMSYRRAWLLVDDLNAAFRAPLVATSPGGAKGGGAHLTEAGRRVVAAYRGIEGRLTRAANPELAVLGRLSAAAPAHLRPPRRKLAARTRST